MKNRYFLLLLISTIGLSSNAQINPFHSANLKLRTFLSPLSLPPNPKYFLYDMVAHVTDPVFFQTKSSDTLTTDDWYRIYEEMFYMAFDTTMFNRPDSVYNQGNGFFSDTIPLGAMSYDYYKLIDSALTTLTFFDFDTLNNTISDKSPRIGYPFLDSSIFAVAPLVDRSYFVNPTFRIDPQFMFKDLFNADHFSNEADFRIDFGDGNGWVQIDPTVVTHINVTYPSSGSYFIQAAIFGNPQSALPTHSSSSAMYIVSNQQYTPPNSSLNLPGIRTGVYNGCNSQGLMDGKIVILLEGWDIFDYLPSKNTTVEQTYASAIQSNELAELRNFGYSFVVVDWKNSRADMRFNALYILNLIEHLKCGLDQAHQFVVVGQSMGGLIGRYVLTYMESSDYQRQSTAPFLSDIMDINNIGYYLNNQKTLDNLPTTWCLSDKKHNTRVFITQDTPHQGANVPLSVQHAYKGALGIFGPIIGYTLNTLTKGFNLFLDGQAAQEMLIYHVDTKIGTSYSAHPDRTDFMNQLNQMGNWPELCKSVTQSLGSMSGNRQKNYYTNQPRIPGDRLIDFETDLYAWILGFKIGLFSADLECFTNPNYTTQHIYTGTAGSFSIGISVKWIGINITTGYLPIIGESETATAAPTCSSPGGINGGDPLFVSNVPSQSGPYVSNTWITNIFSARQTVTGNGCVNLASHIGWKGFASNNFDYSLCSDGLHFCFVPTISALDYGTPGTVALEHDVFNEPTQTQVTQMGADVMIGQENANYWHLENYVFNDNIDDFVQSTNDKNYYSCSQQGLSVKRGLLNLEIGDEELYLDNATLNHSAFYQTEYDIHVNVYNPYYTYPNHNATINIPSVGLFSKDNPFIITQTGNALFKVDQTNTPTGLGLDYHPPMTGTFQIFDTPLNLCCQNFSTAKGAQEEEKNSSPKSETIFEVFPNPNLGSEIIVNFKIEGKEKVRFFIYNLTGQIITYEYYKYINNGLETFYVMDISSLGLQPGVYIFSLQSGDLVKNKKLIIRHE